jgi:MFS transporter, PPP family, 3-phenylpropionic acid transporter
LRGRCGARTLAGVTAAGPRLALFYASIFLAAGVQLPFWPVWLTSRALTPGEIGALLALGQWIKVASNPLLGMLADRARERRGVPVLLAALCLAGYLLCLPAHGFLALLVPSLVISVCGSALFPLSDAMALNAARSGALDYGRVRLWGTIAFIAATLLGGRLLTGRSADVVLYLLLATTLLVTASACFLPRFDSAKQVPSTGTWRSLIAPRHLIFLGAATLVQASHSVYYAFGTLYWQSIGIDDSWIAALWSEGNVVEILIFFWGADLVRRCGPLGLLALGGGAGILRWTMTAFASSVPALALVQPLHALTFAAAHLGAMTYLARHVPPAYGATAQSIYSATVSIGFGIAALVSGGLYGAVGGKAYLAMAALAAASLALTSALAISRNGRE